MNDLQTCYLLKCSPTKPNTRRDLDYKPPDVIYWKEWAIENQRGDDPRWHTCLMGMHAHSQTGAGRNKLREEEGQWWIYMSPK